MTKKVFVRKLYVFLAGLLILSSCVENREIFEKPDWLKGDNIETLETEGNYIIYLQLMEKAEYTNTVKKQLTTLFVPDDNAFIKYFAEAGINSVDDLTKDQAVELFTRHYMPNPVNANHLIFEKAWQLLESPTGEYASLFFRKVNKSYSLYTDVPRYDKTYKGQELLIYTNTKFIPLFSKQYFHDYNGDGDIDYPFMYPGSQWGGLMHWHSAEILRPAGKENTTNIEDLAVPTSSGFIYRLDKVIGSFPSIEQYLLNNQDKYGLFYDLMQRFATYALSSTDKTGTKRYTKSYTDISNVVLEAGPGGSDPAYMLHMYTVFLPEDNVLQSYLDNTVLKSYTHIDSIPLVTLRYILQSQITNRLELPSKFTKQFYNFYGDISVLSTDDIQPGYMCSNGVVYNSKRILEPNVFLCVPGPLFFNKDYSVFLTMLTNANMIATLSGDKSKALFAPTNDELLAANIRLTATSTGALEIQEMTDDGQWEPMNVDKLTTFVQDHVYDGNLSDLSGEGYLEMNSHNFIYYSGQAVSAGLNTHLGNKADVTDQTEKKNGNLFYIDKPLLTRYRMGQYIMSDASLSKFAELMVKANLLDPNFQETDTRNQYPNIALTEGTVNAYYWTAFIPDNSSVDLAISTGIVDTTNSADLKSFVYNHFVQKTIFDDGKLSGTFNSLNAGSSLQIANSKDNMVITDASGQQVAVNHSDANHLVRRGVVHKITSVLKYK